MQDSAQLTVLHMSKNSGFWFHNIITHRGHNGKNNYAKYWTKIEMCNQIIIISIVFQCVSQPYLLKQKFEILIWGEQL